MNLREDEEEAEDVPSSLPSFRGLFFLHISIVGLREKDGTDGGGKLARRE
jgi:hypothetical protein